MKAIMRIQGRSNQGVRCGMWFTVGVKARVRVGVVGPMTFVKLAFNFYILRGEEGVPYCSEYS